MIADPREIQRLRYREGQDLLSRDLRDQARFEEQLRWWHNRAAHGVFGVRSGLRVTLSGQRVEVGRGLAYDGFGRELILLTDRELPIPPAPGDGAGRILILRFREGDAAAAPGELAGVCFGGPASQGAELAWIGAQRLRAADGVPLARLTWDGEPSLQPDFPTPVARPLARPRLGSGHTLPGGTAWKGSKLIRLPDGITVAFDLEVLIETGAAGFTQVPCYFASLQWTRPSDATAPGFLDGIPLSFHVAAEARNTFKAHVHIRLAVPDIRITDLLHMDDIYQSLLQSLARQQLSVCWLGIQMRDDEAILPEVTHGHS